MIVFTKDTSNRLGINYSCKTLTIKKNNIAAIPGVISTSAEHTELMCVHHMSTSDPGTDARFDTPNPNFSQSSQKATKSWH